MENTTRDFKEIINSDFLSWCKLKKKEPTNEALVEYLLSRRLITDLTIKRFVVVSKYPEMLSDSMGIKAVAVWNLEDKYKIPESTIKVILRRFQSFFR